MIDFTTNAPERWAVHARIDELLGRGIRHRRYNDYRHMEDQPGTANIDAEIARLRAKYGEAAK
jgi:hypothetical protein